MVIPQFPPDELVVLLLVLEVDEVELFLTSQPIGRQLQISGSNAAQGSGQFFIPQFPEVVLEVEEDVEVLLHEPLVTLLTPLTLA